MRIGRAVLWTGLLSALMTAPVTTAMAQSDFDGNDIAFGPTLSTLGFGAEVSFKLQNNFVLRINGNYFTHDENDTIDGIAYKFDIDLASVGALVDFHPMGNGFLLSGGVYWNGNKGDLRSTPTSSITIGNTSFTPAQVGTLRGKLEYNEVAPYFGIGYDSAFVNNGPLSFNIRLGLFYMGNAKVRLTGSGTLAGTGAFESELRREEANIEDDLDVFGFYPALTIGFKYRF